MTHDNRNRVPRAAAGVLGVALVIVLANLLVNAVVLPHVDLPDLPRPADLPLPDIPGWVAFVLGKGKLIVIAVIVVLAVIGEETARRRGDGGDAEAGGA